RGPYPGLPLFLRARQLIPAPITPYSGGSLPIATTKAEGLEQSKCKKDCPECYSAGDCTAASVRRTATTEGDIDGLNLLVYCDDSASPDGLNAAEAKCADTVAKTLSNFAAKKLKCLSKCRSDEHKGKVAAGSCTPPPSDMKASDCIGKNQTKAAALRDNKCEAAAAPKADKPDCYGSTDGAAWVATWRRSSTTAMPASTAPPRAGHSSTETTTADGPASSNRPARPCRAALVAPVLRVRG